MKKNLAILLALMALGVGSAYGAEGKGDKVGQADETGMNIGALLGLAFPSGGSDLVFGLDGNYKLDPFWGVGLYATYQGESTTGAGFTTESSNVTVMPEVSYFFQDAMSGLRVGGKAGLRFASSEVTPALPPPAISSVDDTAFIFGPHIGYDYPLGGDLSLGAEFNLLFSTTASDDASPNLLGALKYWF
jgi:hypothetical protein